MLVVDCPQKETSLPKIASRVDKDFPAFRIAAGPNQLLNQLRVVGYRRACSSPRRSGQNLVCCSRYCESRIIQNAYSFQPEAGA